MTPSDSHSTGDSGNGVSLTEIDRAILEQLSLDPLASNRTIAEALGLSTNQVSARTRRFDKQQITRVVATLDLTTAGQTFCFVKIVIQNRSMRDVASEISEIPQVLGVFELISGEDDLLIQLRFSSRHDLIKVISNSLNKVRGVYRVHTSPVLDIPLFRREYITYMPHFLPMDIEENVQDIADNYSEDVIDTVDRYIIAELQKDGNKSINEIARRYDINPGTIRYRVKNLEARGLIRFMTLHDPIALGIQAVALIEMEVAANHIEKVIKGLKKIKGIQQVFICAGSAPIKFYVQADSFETILQLKKESLSILNGVISINVTPLGEVHKIDMRWAQSPTE